MRSIIASFQLTSFLLVTCMFRLAPSFADPPGFRKLSITQTSNDVEFTPQLNDLGHIVWSSRIGGFNNDTKEEIYLCADGVTTRLTTNAVQERFPDINDADVVVWSRFDGPDNTYGKTGEIVRWTSGSEDYMTDDSADDMGPRINGNGEVLWKKYTYKGCAGSNMYLLLFDGVEVRDLTDGSYSDQLGAMNDRLQLVWTRYDFCLNPWESEIFLMDSDGAITQLSDGFEPQVPSIAPTGVVAWTDSNAIYMWNDGTVTQITDDGRNPLINSRGDMAFIRWNKGKRLWESWLHIGGEFRRIAASSQWEISYDMNERGDIVVQSSNSELSKSEIVLYKRLPDGDMNCDEKVDFDDIDGFVEAITDRDVYEANNKNCDWWLADCNGDRKIDFNDIDAFVDCLINNGCP